MIVETTMSPRLSVRSSPFGSVSQSQKLQHANQEPPFLWYTGCPVVPFPVIGGAWLAVVKLYPGPEIRILVVCGCLQACGRREMMQHVLKSGTGPRRRRLCQHHIVFASLIIVSEGLLKMMDRLFVLRLHCLWRSVHEVVKRVHLVVVATLLTEES